MSGFRDLARPAIEAAFSAFAEPVTITVSGSDPVETFALVNPGAEVHDDYGVVVDTRIEIEFRRADVSGATRGTIVETGSERFELISPLGDDGIVLRWQATELQ